MDTTRANRFLSVLLAAVLAAALAATASAVMTSEKLERNVCLTTGGGRYVAIPGFPGERIDRRLLNDVKYLQRKYKIFVTDGYSDDPVHAANGEHPIGLALDIVPDVAAGGTWRDITALARWAEPRQDQPIAPFRWVGYDGDEGHGRGHHLHLSWNHSESKHGVMPASVYTLRCPGAPSAPTGGAPDAGGGVRANDDGSRDGKGDGRGGKKHDGGTTSGGVDPGDGGPADNSGGIGAGRIAPQPGFDLGAPVIETGGIGLR